MLKHDAIHDVICVPKDRVSEAKLLELASLGFTATVRAAKVGAIAIDVLSFPLRRETNMQDCHAIAEVVYGESLDRGFILYESVSHILPLPLLVPKRASVTVDHHHEAGLADREREERSIAAYKPLFRRLARLTGLRVFFHRMRERDALAPFTDNDIHIVAFRHPPGLSGTRWVALAHGIPIRSDADKIACLGPARGRGVIMRDKDGQATVQVISRTIYLLIPTLSYFHSQSRRLFERLLADGLEGMRQYEQRKPEESVDERGFVETTSEWVMASPERTKKDIGEIRKRIEDLTQQLTLAFKNIALFEAYFAKCEETTFFQENIRRMPADFAAISTDRRVKRVFIVDDALHVETLPLALEHDGVFYDVGSFEIRIEAVAYSVWGLRPTHPLGIPHPHIDHDGPCYGNAKIAIAQAVAEFRFADAVNHILTWLTEGYEPPLARVKIEAWPKVTKEDS